MHHQQALKKKELHQRGSLLDAWIKCKGLPDGYDSDEDAFGRRGGIDEIGLHASSKKADDAHDLSDMENVPYGDIGARATLLAHAFSKVGKVLDRVRVRRPRGIYPPAPQTEAIASSTKTLTQQSQTTPYSRIRIPEASSPAPGSVTSKDLPQSRMAADDPRRKRPYKARARKGEGARNPQNRHLAVQQRENPKGAGSPSPATASEIAGGRRRAQGSRVSEGGSMKRKRAQTRADGDGVQKGQVGVPMDVWASAGDGSPALKRLKGDDATEDDQSVADMDLDEELLGGDDYDERLSEPPDEDEEGDVDMQDEDDLDDDMDEGETEVEVRAADGVPAG